MKTLLKVYQFLGSIYFAILLIALMAVFVAAGTFLEAYSESHLFSASFTYNHPLFLALIWGFFINILISALRRWPFQPHHVPFLLTHLGLLMLLGGVIIKSYLGTQGSLFVMEGGSSSRVFVPYTHHLYIENKDLQNKERHFSLEQLLKHKIKFDDVEIRLADYGRHSQERKETWIKDNHVIIAGLPPIPLQNYQNEILPNPSTQVHFHHATSTPWQILAVATNQVGQVARQAYLNNLKVQISDSKTGEVLLTIPLLDTFDSFLTVGNFRISFDLDWNFSYQNSLENPLLNVQINDEKMKIALMGHDSLVNHNLTSAYRGKLPLNIDLVKEPILLFVQDDQADDYLFFYNAHGEIHSAFFKHDNLQSLIAYDEGFGGYAVQTPFPFEDFSRSRQDKEQAELFRLAVHLRQSLDMSELSPPLKLLKKATDKTSQDFVHVLFHFLEGWHKSSELLFNSAHPLVHAIDWNQLDPKAQNACAWLCILLDEMENQLLAGKGFFQLLKERRWPFAEQFAEIEDHEVDHMISLFAQQLFAASDQLPQANFTAEMKSGKALSAYLRVFGITLNNIVQPLESPQTLKHYHAARLYNDTVRKILSPIARQPSKVLAKFIEAMPDDSLLLVEIQKAYHSFQKQCGMKFSSPSRQEIGQSLIDYAPLNEKALSSNEAEHLTNCLNAKDVIIETPLTLKQRKIPALQKWEDNHPLITLEVKKGKQKEYFTLTYDNYATGLAWPILNGQYKLRFQSLSVDIPYRVRLHDARQINYPGTQQPYSYESDILVTDLRDKKQIEKTISMNNVHETTDGYRFYLSSLSPSQEVTSQRVQIVVNHDPAKYFLTYPGALILSLGIFLLFWLKPYKK